MPLKRNQPPRPTPLKRSVSPDVVSNEESLSPTSDSTPLSTSSPEALLAVLKELKSNPEVAYVLASVKKGLAGAATLSPEQKQQLLLEVQRALEQSPTILKALREYRGSSAA